MWLSSIRFPDHVTWYNKWQKMEAMVDVWLYLDIRNAHCLTSLQGFLQGLLLLDTLTFSRWVDSHKSRWNTEKCHQRPKRDGGSDVFANRFEFWLNFFKWIFKLQLKNLTPEVWSDETSKDLMLESPVYHTVDGRNPAPPGMVKTL